MRVFNENKTIELTAYDLEKGYLKADKIFVKHHEAIQAVAEQGHYETIAEYPNGGKDVKWVIDVAEVKAKDAWDEYEDIQVYVPYTADELDKIELSLLRSRRGKECFPVINRGKLWYNRLTDEQYDELNAWYEAWLNVTESRIIPERPEWVDTALSGEEIL